MFLPGSEVVGGGHGAGEDIFVVDVESHFAQFIAYVAVGPLTIIGQKKEWVSFIPQVIDEFNCAGYGLAAFVNNPVHIN